MTDDEWMFDVTDRLVASYAQDGGVNPAHRGLPARASVEEVLHQTEALLFPGFATAENLALGARRVATAHHLSVLAHNVQELVCRNMHYSAASEGAPPCDPAEVEERAQRCARDFIGCLPDLRQTLLLDIHALQQGDPACQSTDEVILAYPGLRAVIVHRVAHFFWTCGARLIARMMSESVHSKTGIDIHPGATIGQYFYIDHGTGVVVGETSVIGDHVKIYQGVSLGAHSVSRRYTGQKRHPTIEDHVTIYAGATILGGDTTIGHHSIIGGNVWVIKSVSPYSIVENDPRISVRSKVAQSDWYYEI